MAEEVTKYVVSVAFDDALRNVNRFINRMSKMEQGREAALNRQIRLQRQLNTLRMSGGMGGTGSSGNNNPPAARPPRTANPNIGPQQQNVNNANRRSSPMVGPARDEEARVLRRRLQESDRATRTAERAAASRARTEERGLANNRPSSPMVGPSRNAEADAMRARLRAADRLQSSLNTQLTSARRIVDVMNEEDNVATRNAATAIRSRIATARTADEVRDIVAQERARLRIARRNTSEAERQNFLLNRMRASSRQVAGNMVSVFAAGAAGAFITKTGQDFESVNNTMLAVSVDAKEAGENFEFVRNEAFRLGAGLTQSAKGFAKLRAAQGEMKLADTRALFTGTAEMSSLLGLTAEESGRALSAIQQMASKGVVSAKTLAL